MRGSAHWDVDAYLLANVIDLLQTQLAQSAGKKKRPKPFPRPGGKATTTLGGAGMTIEEYEARRNGPWVDVDVEEVA